MKNQAKPHSEQTKQQTNQTRHKAKRAPNEEIQLTNLKLQTHHLHDSIFGEAATSYLIL
jgi:hypothetical protein